MIPFTTFAIGTAPGLLAVAGRLAAEGPVDVVPTFLGAHTIPSERREQRVAEPGRTREHALHAGHAIANPRQRLDQRWQDLADFVRAAARQQRKQGAVFRAEASRFDHQQYHIDVGQRLEGLVRELFDVAVIPGVRAPG